MTVFSPDSMDELQDQRDWLLVHPFHYFGMDGLTAEDANMARDVIARQLNVMVRLVDDLFDVSRYRRNKLNIRKERVELAAVVESAVESGRSLIDQCGHKLTVSMPCAPLLLDADPIRLAQVLSNLLNNSAKYTAPGGRIWLTAERAEKDVIVSVRDNGINIHNDMILRVFGMFTQVDGASGQSQGGLGIGLTLVKRLVELHDGSIEAQSHGIDQGSEFVIRLPLRIETQLTLPQKDEAPAVPHSREVSKC